MVIKAAKLIESERQLLLWHNFRARYDTCMQTDAVELRQFKPQLLIAKVKYTHSRAKLSEHTWQTRIFTAAGTPTTPCLPLLRAVSFVATSFNPLH